VAAAARFKRVVETKMRVLCIEPLQLATSARVGRHVQPKRGPGSRIGALVRRRRGRRRNGPRQPADNEAPAPASNMRRREQNARRHEHPTPAFRPTRREAGDHRRAIAGERPAPAGADAEMARPTAQSESRPPETQHGSKERCRQRISGQRRGIGSYIHVDQPIRVELAQQVAQVGF
jgi:hypothetical protein